MKRSILFSLLSATLFVVTSCSKDNDNPTACDKDKGEAINPACMEMEEIIHVENNNQIYYKRGGNTNTNNYDNDKIICLANGTGNYSPTPSQTLPLTWEFTNSDKTKLNMVITFSAAVVLTLKCSEVDLSDNRFFASATIRTLHPSRS